MKRSNALRRRLHEIERARGSNGFTLFFADGTIQSFVLASQVDALRILFAAIDLANDAPAPKDDRFTRIAREVGKSDGATPDDEELYATVRHLVRGADSGIANLEKKQNATL
jgi:hypothetical protein